MSMPKDVMCEVDNCTFWSEGNLCSAERIYVVSKKGKKVNNEEETDCYTFQPKNK